MSDLTRFPLPRFTTVISATGPQGNIFAILGTACQFMRELDIPGEERKDFAQKVISAKSYAEAVEAVREWFPVDTGDS